MKNIFVIGGAGFIGSNLVHNLLIETLDNITIFDNFSSGKIRPNHPRAKIIEGDVKDAPFLKNSMKGADVIYHFASNPDISKAVQQPTIDFWEGTYLTQNVLEAMRINNVKKLFYPSGSGVYGETGLQKVQENFSPMNPISTYGASKLASEAMISAYCHMFDMTGYAFRFANVVGPNQTHGVGRAFIQKLINDPFKLEILGDGKQTKSYLHVQEAIRAMKVADNSGLEGFHAFNVATEDTLSVNEIALLVKESLCLGKVEFIYTGGDRGWKGDVPVIILDSNKIRNLGWRNLLNSEQAMRNSLKYMAFFGV